MDSFIIVVATGISLAGIAGLLTPLFDRFEKRHLNR